MPKKPESQVRSENLAMLTGYFNYIFVHLRQKLRFRPKLSANILSILGPNPARTLTRPEKPGPTCNSEALNPHYETRLVVKVML